ncbi:MAG: hypothetical protein D6693_07970 [Planctomycetota bacterium]|nr:MAG: hypothetical protein D6693_07970 [Planctomycetota bacterium]
MAGEKTNRPVPRPDTLGRTLDATAVGALAFGAGVIAATGLAAALAFPTMRDLDPTLPGLGVAGDHWMIAAGSVMAPVFTIAVAVAGIAVALAGLVWVGRTLRGGASAAALVVRGVAILAALAVVGYAQFVLLPRMNHNFASFLAAARTGDAPAAEGFRDAFDRDHPASSRALGAIVTLTLVAAGAHAWPAPVGGRRRRSEAPGS